MVLCWFKSDQKFWIITYSRLLNIVTFWDLFYVNQPCTLYLILKRYFVHKFQRNSKILRFVLKQFRVMALYLAESPLSLAIEFLIIQHQSLYCSLQNHLKNRLACQKQLATTARRTKTIIASLTKHYSCNDDISGSHIEAEPLWIATSQKRTLQEKTTTVSQ